MVPVPLVFRGQIHIVAVGDAAQLFRIGRPLKHMALKLDILMGHHDALGIALIEPGSIGMHVEIGIAEHMAESAKSRKDGIMQ